MIIIAILVVFLPLYYALPIHYYQSEIEKLHTLVQDLQLSQRELKQSSNDHVIVSWL